MTQQDKDYKIKESDKAKKISPKDDDEIKNDLNAHNITEEARDRVGPPNRTKIVTFEIKPELNRVEELVEAYEKFALDLNYNRTSWYTLPEVSKDGKTVKMIFDGERDLALFQQRLKDAGISASLLDE